MAQDPIDEGSMAALLAMLCGGGGLLFAGYIATVFGYGKLFNKTVDERIEREAEVYRRGFRE